MVKSGVSRAGPARAPPPPSAAAGESASDDDSDDGKPFEITGCDDKTR